METEPLLLEVLQPHLFDFAEMSTGTVELFPAVWSATEDLSASEPQRRLQALDRLMEIGAPRLSPLVTYVLATRIMDPDLIFRSRVVRALGVLLLPDLDGNAAPEIVRRCLTAYLGHMRTRSVFNLVEVGVKDSDTDEHIARLLNACPHAGKHLADILSDRKAPLAIRRQAVHFIGLVGYLEVIPTLERLAKRLDARLKGQVAMSFAPPAVPNELDLLPAIQGALAMLNAT